MTLEGRIQALAQRLANITKTHKNSIGTLASLTTTEKSSLVGALNELKSIMASIDDATTSSSSVWSSSKVNTMINTAIANLINGSPTNADTLKELSDQLLALVQADTWLVSAVASQTFTDPQKTQARANIGSASQADLDTLTTNVGNTDHNYVTDFDNIYNA